MSAWQTPQEFDWASALLSDVECVVKQGFYRGRRIIAEVRNDDDGESYWLSCMEEEIEPQDLRIVRRCDEIGVPFPLPTTNRKEKMI